MFLLAPCRLRAGVLLFSLDLQVYVVCLVEFFPPVFEIIKEKGSYKYISEIVYSRVQQ
jgi:hypothetical protein